MEVLVLLCYPLHSPYDRVRVRVTTLALLKETQCRVMGWRWVVNLISQLYIDMTITIICMFGAYIMKS